MQENNVSVQNFVEEYKVLYHAFQQLNCFCWQNRLPLCKLVVFRRGSCYAADGWACKEKPYHTIGLNLSYFEYADDKEFMLTLAHEMVHIWQFENGSSGGHMADFKNEMFRIGITYQRCNSFEEYIRSDSPVDYCLNVRRIMRLDSSVAFRQIAQKGCSSQRDQENFEIIRKQQSTVSMVKESSERQHILPSDAAVTGECVRKSNLKMEKNIPLHFSCFPLDKNNFPAIITESGLTFGDRIHDYCQKCSAV